jgi:hypothetical protein
MAPVLARACPEVFEAIFGTRDELRLAADYQKWVAMDAASHRWVYRRLSEWASMEESAMDGAERGRMLITIYQMHVPLKRLAFRLGYLRGMELVDDARWQERKPAGLWQRIVKG